jgi:hypothetical protein
VLLVVQRGNLLLAEVAGSEYRPYEVQATLGGMVTAVNWARRARDIYLLHQRQTEWHNYLSVRRFVA